MTITTLYRGLCLGGIGLVLGCSGIAERPPARRGAGIVREIDQRNDNPIALMIDDEPVGWGEIRPLLGEAGGGPVVREVVLGRLLDRACEYEGIDITKLAIARERELLGESLIGATGSPAGARLIETMRVRRGLGERRFAGLLRRNAQLRALVGGGSRASEAQVKLARRIRVGPRRRVRVLTSPNAHLLASVRQRVLNLDGAGPRAEAFARAAREHSTDPSAGDGGLLEPVSLEDPSVPEVLRRAIGRTPPGQVTPITTIGGLSAIVLVGGEVPGQGALTGEQETQLRRTMDRASEHEAMARLSERLLSEARVSVLDRSLGWAYRQTR